MPPKIEEAFGGFDKVVSYLMPFAVLLSIIFIIMGGYMWMTSAGNPDKVKQAQATLTWAIIGLIFVLIAGLLIRILIDYFV